MVPEELAWPLCLYYMLSLWNSVSAAIKSLVSLVTIQDEIGDFFDVLKGRLNGNGTGMMYRE